MLRASHFSAGDALKSLSESAWLVPSLPQSQAIEPIMTLPRPAQYQPISTISERRLWATVLLAVIEDYRREYWAATERTSYPRPEGVISDLRYYFASRDGRMVCTMAGVEELCAELVIQYVRDPNKRIGRRMGFWVSATPPQRPNLWRVSASSGSQSNKFTLDWRYSRHGHENVTSI